jgi:hypothetical protein
MVASDSEVERAAEIRPGVFRPDWSVATSSASRAALVGRAAARVGLLDQWTTRLDPEPDLVWRTILRLYAALGSAPGTVDLAAASGIESDKLMHILVDLEARDLIGLDHSAKALRLAYPFTEADTGHRVRVNGRTLNALCAIDALGVGSMYCIDAAVSSLCRHCGHGIEVATTSAGCSVASMNPPQGLVWYDFSYDGRAARSCCPSIAFFCSRQHLDQWFNGQASKPEGLCLSIDEALQVGRAIFGPVLVEPKS